MKNSLERSRYLDVGSRNVYRMDLREDPYITTPLNFATTNQTSTYVLAGEITPQQTLDKKNKKSSGQNRQCSLMHTTERFLCKWIYKGFWCYY